MSASSDAKSAAGGRHNALIAIACVVLVVSPALQLLAAGRGVQLTGVFAALLLGAVALWLYLKVLRRARSDPERPPQA